MSLNKKSVDDINVKGKRVLVRCDFNVPLKNGEITDEEIIKSLVETVNEEVIYIENNDVKELEKETFQNNFR